MQLTKIVLGDAHWLDVVEPTAEGLQKVADEYGLHATSVKDCLDPQHLPKFEKIGNVNFLILRTFDQASSTEADTVQELTFKVAVFYTDKFVITVHRKDHPAIEALRVKWNTLKVDPSNHFVSRVLGDLLKDVLNSFEGPIEHAIDLFEELEMDVFEAQHARSKPFRIEDGYYLKREAFVFKRMIRVTSDLLKRMSADLKLEPTYIQDLHDKADALFFYADELMENINTLLNLYVSLSTQKTNLASHRTNEIMRVLTIISVFLLPLNVVTGIYGMNFRFMPELGWLLGYPFALAIMIVISLTTYFWFRNKGWLRSS